ncbi:MAG: type II toxin-antitoxin system RelE/ParE family toxin [Oscillospiraceae bacterium]|nr:type II toxin-antitoxin system RelE/ParE family toxin [Oscillospiraceae bacterium]
MGDYIAGELKNPGAALRTVNDIQDTIDKLAAFPLMGTRLSAVAEVDTDYRFLVCGKYVAFYRAQDGRVLIDRVLYGKRDYLAILLRGLDLAGVE